MLAVTAMPTEMVATSSGRAGSMSATVTVMASTSASAVSPETTYRPPSPKIWLAARATKAMTVISSAIFTTCESSKGLPGTSASEAASARATNRSAAESITPPATSNPGSSRSASVGARAKSSSAVRMSDTLPAAIAPAAGPTAVAVTLLRRAMASVVAVEETSPPIAPATRSPLPPPMRRTAT